MRLALRVLLASMGAIETALEDIQNQIRNTGDKDKAQFQAICMQARKSQREARKTAHDLLDKMIDAGVD